MLRSLILAAHDVFIRTKSIVRITILRPMENVKFSGLVQETSRSDMMAQGHDRDLQIVFFEDILGTRRSCDKDRPQNIQCSRLASRNNEMVLRHSAWSSNEAPEKRATRERKYGSSSLSFRIYGSARR